jgi:hypothetical protein
MRAQEGEGTRGKKVEEVVYHGGVLGEGVVAGGEARRRDLGRSGGAAGRSVMGEARDLRPACLPSV